MTLGDMGADVIKIERPRVGDETRTWGPPFDSRGESAYYLSVNRNKVSAALDFGNAEDVRLIRALASSADVVIENFRPGALDRAGISCEALLAENPQLIWCTLTGFGTDTNRPGYDFVVQAESGWMSITGEPDGAPMKVGVALADVIAGKDAMAAILAALVARERRALAPAERRLTVSLIRSATAALVNVAQNTLVSGNDARRWGNAHANLCPYELFQAADRALVVAVGSDAQWRACTEALGLTHLRDDSRLGENAGRLAHRQLVVDEMARAIREKTATHWMERLDAAGVPCGIVRTVREAVLDAGGSPLTGVPPLPPGSIRRPPPRLNEQGAMIRESGWGVFETAFPSPDNEASIRLATS